MPNWCYGSLVFYGRRENVIKFCEDIEFILSYDDHKAIGNRMRVNMFPFLEHIGIDPIAYQQTAINNAKKKYKDEDIKDDINRNIIEVTNRPNFRAYWFEEPYVLYDNFGLMQVAVGVDSAWNLDPKLLDLISLHYQILYTFYAEECGMGLYYKGYNGFLPPTPEDTVITNIYNEESDEYSAEIPCLSHQVENIKQKLEGCEYSIIEIENDGLSEPSVLGMYYDEENKDLAIGMSYDAEIK